MQIDVQNLKQNLLWAKAFIFKKLILHRNGFPALIINTQT